jgi:hypothetical protein
MLFGFKEKTPKIIWKISFTLTLLVFLVQKKESVFCDPHPTKHSLGDEIGPSGK